MPNKRNLPCPCEKNKIKQKKYKHCYELNDIYKKQKLNVVSDNFKTGHKISSSIVQDVYNAIKKVHNLKIIDISNLLAGNIYHSIQEYNYYRSIIMIAERNLLNESVFYTRASSEHNIMVMFKGAYQCFRYLPEDDSDLTIAINTINKLIGIRESGNYYDATKNRK